MNERYREAAEWLHRYSLKLFRESIALDGTLIDEGAQRRSEQADAIARILSKLATGEWVLCESDGSMTLPNGGIVYYPIPELP